MDNNNSKLDLTIHSKRGIIFKNRVEAVTSYNEKGVFDILPEHESFISLIKEKVIIHPTKKENTEIQIENGILRTYKDKVYVYVNFKS